MEEVNQKQKITPISFNLNLSERGELQLKGDIKPEDIQPILDASHLRYSLYLEHQAQLSKEADKTAICIGLIFSSLIGLAVFCLFNLSIKHTQSEVIKSESVKFFIS